MIFIISGLLTFFFIAFPHKLNKRQRKMIENYGIIHFTGIKSKEIIISSKVIKYDSMGKSYFFINDIIRKESIVTNRLQEKTYAIVITNLSDMQISNFRIRNVDLALEYKGDFFIMKNNVSQCTKRSCLKLKIDFLSLKAMLVFLVFSILLSTIGLLILILSIQ